MFRNKTAKNNVSEIKFVRSLVINVCELHLLPPNSRVIHQFYIHIFHFREFLKHLKLSKHNLCVDTLLNKTGITNIISSSQKVVHILPNGNIM